MPTYTPSQRPVTTPAPNQRVRISPTFAPSSSSITIPSFTSTQPTLTASDKASSNSAVKNYVIISGLTLAAFVFVGMPLMTCVYNKAKSRRNILPIESPEITMITYSDPQQSRESDSENSSISNDRDDDVESHSSSSSSCPSPRITESGSERSSISRYFARYLGNDASNPSVTSSNYPSPRSTKNHSEHSSISNHANAEPDNGSSNSSVYSSHKSFLMDIEKNSAHSSISNHANVEPDNGSSNSSVYSSHKSFLRSVEINSEHSSLSRYLARYVNNDARSRPTDSLGDQSYEAFVGNDEKLSDSGTSVY
ncbi:MAG: hypothetical protein V4544_05430 [Pseudomonadota bacterium]